MSPLVCRSRPPRRGHRRQPHPVRPLRRPVRDRLQPGHAHRRPGRSRRAVRARRGSGSASSSRAPSSSTAATSTSPARPSSARDSTRAPPRTTSSRPAAPGSRPSSPSPTRSRSAQIDVRDRGRRRHRERRAPRRQRRTAPHPARRPPREVGRRPGSRRWPGIRPRHLVPDIPRNAEPRTGLSMGEHAAITARAVGHRPRGRRTNSPPPVTSGSPPRTNAASSTTSSSPTAGLARDQNLRPDSTAGETRHAQAGVRHRRPRRDDDRRATRPRSPTAPPTVLLASEEWAEARGLEPLAYLTAYETAAVDFVAERRREAGC